VGQLQQTKESNGKPTEPKYFENVRGGGGREEEEDGEGE
jgi:hypothetical protein